MDISEQELLPLIRHRYALINPLQVDAEMLEDLSLTPLVHKRLGARENQMPLLIDLSVMSLHDRDELLDRSLEWLNQRRMPFFSALIDTFVSLKALKSHLISRMLLRRKDGKSFMFRYFDPRVFEHLLWINTDRQHAALLGPIRRWSWWDRHGLWHTCTPTAGRDGWSDGYSLDQLKTLNRIGLINSCIDELEQEHTLLPTEILKASPRIAELIDKTVTDHLLNDEEDIRLLVKQFWLDRDIHTHPLIEARLEQTRTTTISYVRACADLNPAEMTQVLIDLDHQRRGIRTPHSQGA